MKTPYTLMRILAHLGRHRRQKRKDAFSPQRIRRIWVHKPDRLGDALLARPALAMLRSAWPEADICVVCHPAAAPLLKMDRDGYQVFPWSSRFLGGDGGLREYRRRFKQFSPDLLVNLRHDLRDIVWCVSLAAPYLVTYDHNGLGAWATHPGPPPQPQLPEAENHAQLLAFTLGLTPIAAEPLEVPAADLAEASETWESIALKGPKIIIHAAARTQAKLWPLAHWRSLIDLLISRTSAKVAIIGDQTDSFWNSELARNQSNIKDCTGRLAPSQLASIIKSADLFIGIDSGPGHLAQAVGTPTVSVMSGTNVLTRWAPNAVSSLHHAVSCSPCHLENCPMAGHPCMRRLMPDEVFKVAEKELSQ